MRVEHDLSEPIQWRSPERRKEKEEKEEEKKEEKCGSLPTADIVGAVGKKITKINPKIAIIKC